MKKMRVSRNCIAEKQEIDATNLNDDAIQRSGTAFIDLPHSLLVIILLKLSVKRVVICKCVCKTWRDSISDPEFAKLHFAQPDTLPMIRTNNRRRVSRIIYLLQPENYPDLITIFYCNCSGSYKCGWCCHQFTMKLESKLKLPLQDLEYLFQENKIEQCEFVGMMQRKKCVKVMPISQRYSIVNSCNGLLCLSESWFNIPIAVCNPVTSEFVKLLPSKDFDRPRYRGGQLDCGFGFSPATNEYKVITMFDHDAS